MGRQLLNGIVNRVAFCGIELEGGWDENPATPIVHDGSVQFEDPYIETVIDPQTGRRRKVERATRGPFPRLGVGEVVSPKLLVGQVEGWLRACYPQHVNETCGLHVHMSFHHKLNYSRLMTPDYMTQLLRELRNWADAEQLPPNHMMRNRLDPTHPWTLQHCAHQFLADKQVLVRKKDYNSRNKAYSRYTFLNYCDGQHNTIECRGLSMFGGMPTTGGDVDQALRAIMVVLNTTNRFLSRVRQREQVAIAEVIERPDINREFGAIVR